MALEIFFLAGLQLCQSNILFNHAIGIHIAGKLHGAHQCVAVCKIAGHEPAFFIGHPLFVDDPRIGIHKAADQLGQCLRHTGNILAFRVRLDDRLDHIAEFLISLGFFGNAGCLCQIPTVHYVPIQHTVSNIAIGGTRNHVQLAIPGRGLRTLHLQVLGQVWIIRQVLRQGTNHALLDPVPIE